MSEHVALGAADADVAWLGIRRHQALLAVVALVLVGEGVMSRRTPFEALIGVVVLGCAAPVTEGRTVGEYGVVVVQFLFRRHWCAFDVREFGDDVLVWSRTGVSLRGYRLGHLGRLDLSGRDVTLAESLASLVDAASAARATRHLSQHVHHRGEYPTTLLTLPADLSAPEGWVLENELALEVLGAVGGTAQYLERFSYLRTPDGVARVFRVRDFSAVPSRRALLEQLVRAPTPLDVAVHLDVVSGDRASRVAARAVHRVDSDDASGRAAGFRRTARSARSIDRMTQREILVAQGRALVRVAVFVVVRATTLEALGERSVATWRCAHDAGLRLDRGRGVQAQWYRAQLPGGVNG